MYFLFVPYMYFILVLGKEWKRILVMLLCVIISFLLFITFFFEEYVIEIFICIIFGVFFFAIGMIYMTVKETSDKVSLLEKTVTLCFEIILMLIALSLSGIIFFFDLNGKNPSFVSFIQENTSIECLWGVFGVFIVCLVIIWPIISNYYNKMVDLAFLYGEKNDKTSQGENNKSRIYIYTRIGNQFLYGDKDRLQYNKKEFDDELRKIKEQIKKKKWDSKNNTRNNARNNNTRTGNNNRNNNANSNSKNSRKSSTKTSSKYITSINIVTSNSISINNN